MTQHTVRTAIETLLAAAPEGQRAGFVIFDQGAALQYVQFALQENGLMLNHPTVQAGGVTALPHVRDVLLELGFLEAKGAVGDLRPNELVVYDDGLYANFGRDVSLAEAATKTCFQRAFGGFDEAKLSVNLDVEG